MLFHFSSNSGDKVSVEAESEDLARPLAMEKLWGGRFPAVPTFSVLGIAQGGVGLLREVGPT